MDGRVIFPNVLTDCFADDERQRCFWEDSKTSCFSQEGVDEGCRNRRIQTIDRTYFGEISRLVWNEMYAA
jgi:hypothetical protein